MIYLRQSTASQSVLLGPFIDDTDGKTAETGLTIANTDIRLSKNGGNMAAKNSGGGTHDEAGWYTITLDATDTNTVGRLQISVDVAGALPVWMECQVLEESIYDALFAASAAGYSTLDAAGVRTAVGLASANLDTQLADIPTVAEFEARTLAAANYFDPATDTVANVTTVGSVANLTVNAGAVLASGTHNPQSGDAFARLGAPSGASVSADVAAVKADTAAILLDTGTDGVVVAAGSKTGYSLVPTTGLGNQTANITGNLSGSVGSVTGAVGSVTGNVGGSVTGSVGSISGVTFPTNFGDLAITVTTGRVTVGTNADKSGYSLTPTTGLGNQTANITGSLSGSVGSVTGNVVGDVTGSVGSVLGGINTAAGTIQTLDALDTAQDSQHATTQAAIADVPTVAEFEARTLAAADYFDPSTDAVTLADGAHGGTAAVLTLERFVVASTTAGQPAVKLTGNGAGAGLDVTGGNLAYGASFYAPNAPGFICHSANSPGLLCQSQYGDYGTRLNAVLGSMSSFADNSITASALAPDAVAEIQSGLSTLDAAAVRTAVGLASANLDTQLAALQTDLDTVTDTGVTCVAATSAAVEDVWSTYTIAEAYAADGAAGTPAQLLYLTLQGLTEFAISGTTVTVKKLDGSTTAATFTLDDATTPTSRTRAT